METPVTPHVGSHPAWLCCRDGWEHPEGWEVPLHVPIPSPGEGRQQSGASLKGRGLAVGNESLLCPGRVTLVHVGLEGLGFCFYHPFFPNLSCTSCLDM